MKTNLTKKTYSLFTHPDLPGYSIENYGDREFVLHGEYVRGWTHQTVFINGDSHWEITEESLLAAANFLFEQQIKKLAKKKKKKKTAKGTIGWFDKLLGRIGNYKKA